MAQPFEQILAQIRNNTAQMSETLSAVRISTEKSRELTEATVKQTQQQSRDQSVESARDQADLIRDTGGENSPFGGQGLKKVVSILEELKECACECKCTEGGGGGFDLKSLGKFLPGQGKQTGGFVYPSPIKRQSGGGVFKVPGTSTGDNHDMLLPAGSFVLNRQASKFLTRQIGGGIPETPSPMGFQEGNMVPVKTESNELVFGPNSWSSLIPVLNSVIPRFQSGGLVTHDHTGEGYNPNSGKDSKGRPVVFSKEAAAAFAKMVAEGGVDPKDVASSKRSPAHNKRVGGVANSNHLTGNAVDIHGSSKAWMKQNGEQYGWKWLDYSGHDGHFDFVKGMGGGKPPEEGKEDGEKGNKSGGGLSMPQFNLGNLFKGMDDPQKFSSGREEAEAGFGNIMSNIGGAFDSFKNTIGGILSGGGMGMLSLLGGGGMSLLPGGFLSGMFGGGSGVPTGDINSSSEPLSGDTGQKAKMMFDYIVQKGYTPAQAKGIVANIQRESNFDPKVRSGDDKGPGGLFQWKGSRQTDTVADLVNSGNWKGQIDYALKEDVGPQYKSATAGMNAHEASMWWAEKWERPASLSNADSKHSQFLPSYKFQKGGGVGGLRPVKVESGEMIFSPGSYGPEIPQLNSSIPRFQSGGSVSSAKIKADPSTNIQNFINKRFQNTSQARDMSQTQSNNQPTIIPVPMPMSGGQSGDSGGESGSAIPALTSTPSNHIVSALMMSSYSLMRNIG